MAAGAGGDSVVSLSRSSTSCCESTESAPWFPWVWSSFGFFQSRLNKVRNTPSVHSTAARTRQPSPDRPAHSIVIPTQEGIQIRVRGSNTENCIVQLAIRRGEQSARRHPANSGVAQPPANGTTPCGRLAVHVWPGPSDEAWRGRDAPNVAWNLADTPLGGYAS